jgi:hypothetical protein
VRWQIRFAKNEWERREPSLPSCSLHYIGKRKFTSDPSVEVSFTCHSNGASWASSRGLSSYEYGMSQHPRCVCRRSLGPRYRPVRPRHRSLRPCMLGPRVHASICRREERASERERGGKRNLGCALGGAERAERGKKGEMRRAGEWRKGNK